MRALWMSIARRNSTHAFKRPIFAPLATVEIRNSSSAPDGMANDANPLQPTRTELLVDTGITVAMMGLPQDYFAIGSPWNPATPNAKGYRSLYLSLFGRTLKAGQAATTRCRLVINRQLGDDQAVRRYEAFAREAVRE